MKYMISRLLLIIFFHLNLFATDYETTNDISKRNEYIKTNEFFAKACNSGYAIGCNNLGGKYANGDGVKQDIVRAKEYYDKACSLGLQAGCKNSANLK